MIMNSKEEKMMTVTRASLLMLTLLVVAVNIGEGAVKSINYIYCNPESYADGDPYAKSVSDVLDRVIQDTRTAMSRVGVSAVNDARARAVCRDDSAPEECGGCLRQVRQRVMDTCGNTLGARVQIDYCYLRYENYNFDN